MATIAAPVEFEPLTTTREERGREIAKLGGIHQVGGRFVVPSQSRDARAPTYLVDLVEESCTCPDYETRRQRCKHVEAALFYIAWEGAVSEGGNDGAKPKPKRKTYPRNWRAYNDAARHEVERLRPILQGLCARVPEPERAVGLPGRKPIPLRDLLFALVMKVYTGKSGRSAEAEIRLCAKLGYISRSMQHNAIHRAMEDEALTAILERLVEESAMPLAVVENIAGQFSQDATAFSTKMFGPRWFEHKWPKRDASKQDEKDASKQDASKQDADADKGDDEDIEPRLEDDKGRRKFVKLHATTGALTHCVTCAKVSPEGDCKRLPEQLQRTTRHFNVKEFSADKAYLWDENLRAITAVGARPLIPFKKNSKDHPDDRAWSDMWAHFQLRRDDFLAAYHRRSNCETAMSMIKAKFGASVRSKLPVAQANEIYCKVIAHNLACIVLAISEFGIETPFGKAETSANDRADVEGSSENTLVTLKLVR